MTDRIAETGLPASAKNYTHGQKPGPGDLIDPLGLKM